MNFKGLFIGIDRYNSPGIVWLNSATRDAIALHSLFADNTGGNLTLLTDEKASRTSIEKEFAKLAKCKEDNVVFIAFSGHGSETHELVTYDSVLTDLPNTAIPLDLLAEWFAKISAKRIILVLDCCFSGGIGSKVLKMDFAPRDLPSTESLLSKLSGNGRLIFTASSATEPAWESNRYKHGFLTYHLIEALIGVEEIQESGKIDIYALLKYVTEKVISSVAQIGKVQQPAMRGAIDGSLTLPVFKRGKNFTFNFPEITHPIVKSDIASLVPYGFSKEIVDIWSASIPKLNQLQIDAINEFGVLKGEHLVVSAPTSSGKTMIGELAALQGSLQRQRTIFLLPLKALVNDKHKQFNELYEPYGIRTIRATGDSNDEVPNLMRGQYDICLMTYEKFTSMVLGSPHILEQTGTVVIDEVQMIADKSRGANLEFILTLIRMQRQQGVEPQVIALSAVIGETNGLEKWLGARLLRRTERPVPLDEGIITATGTFRYVESETNTEKSTPNYTTQEPRKGSSQDWIIPLVRKLVSEDKQVIVFREMRGQARGAANYLSENLSLPPAQTALDALPTGDPSTVSEILRKCLSGGVAFHISDLDKDERLVVEEQFRQKNSAIKVIVATTTLAMGVNTPTEAVIIAGLEHPSKPPQPYSVAEYKNIVGRAGRLGFTVRGVSYLLALTPKDEHDYWKRYVKGEPENLSSRFLDGNTDPRSLIVRVLAGARRSAKSEMIGMKSEDIIGFLENSFGAFQQAQMTPGWKWSETELMDSLNNLQGHDLVERTEKGEYKLTELGWLAGQGGIEVESVIRLVDALRPLDSVDITDTTLIATAQLTVELDQILFSVNPKGPQKELDTWTSELQNQNIPEYVLQKLRNGGDTRQIAMRFKKTAACLFWITDKPLADIEEILTKHWGRFDGIAGPMRSVASRTHDLLRTVARVAEILHPDLKLEERTAKLFVRLEVGVPSSIFNLAKKIGPTFSRSDYHSLIKENLSDMEVLKTASDEVILTALGDDEAKFGILKTVVEGFFKTDTGEDMDFFTPSLPPYEA